jgi:choline-phosphate cytidylyltransferase
MNLDAIDGKHARATGNSSPLGELFDHSCDNIGLVFSIMTLCKILNITNPYTQWYYVQLAQIIFLNSHINAFKKKVVEFGLLTGPGEFLISYIFLCFTRIFTDYSWMYELIDELAKQFGISMDELGKIFPATLYYLVYCYVIIRILLIKDHYSTRNGLLITLFLRFVPSILVYFGLIISTEIDTFTIISNGLILSIVTGDIILAKMASRELHPLIPIFIMCSLFDNFICIFLCGFYYIAILTEVSFYLRVPLLTVQTNVFCNGVFDLLHEGHMNLFQKASSYGTRLVVGVHNDEVVKEYKRVPHMEHESRCRTVEKQKYVDEVVPNAPLIITKKFIKQYNIHSIICSSEYDNPDDKYYKVPREMGILHVLPRTKKISTSDIIKKVKET